MNNVSESLRSLRQHSLVDAHHHLWDLGAVHYPWLMEKGVRRFFGDPAPIQRDYLVADFRADIGDLPVRQSVHVQVGAAPDQSLAESRWLQSQADDEGLPSALVAFCDLAAKGLEADLDAQQQFPALRGVRQIVGRSEGEDAQTGTGALIDDPAWRRGLKVLAARGLSFDLQLIPSQLPAVTQVLRGVPGLPVALCHCGSPSDRSAEAMNRWRSNIERLAELPNVACKISGFGMFDPDWTAASVRDIVMPCIDAFGPRRCLFGSNFPVEKLASSYASVYARYAELTATFTDDERQAMLGGNARQFYRLEA